MAKQCSQAYHQKLKELGRDSFCTEWGESVIADALVRVGCGKEHAAHASRGLKHCPECGEQLIPS